MTIDGALLCECEARAASGCCSEASLDVRELVDEYDDEREWRLRDWESDESVVVFSRPRVAMSSTKDGRVVVMAGGRSRGAILVQRPGLRSHNITARHLGNGAGRRETLSEAGCHGQEEVLCVSERRARRVADCTPPCARQKRRQSRPLSGDLMPVMAGTYHSVAHRGCTFAARTIVGGSAALGWLPSGRAVHRETRSLQGSLGDLAISGMQSDTTTCSETTYRRSYPSACIQRRDGVLSRPRHCASASFDEAIVVRVYDILMQHSAR